jgi:hypothetical protein
LIRIPFFLKTFFFFFAEFSSRLGVVEQRLRVVTGERDALKKEVETAKKAAEKTAETEIRELREKAFRLQKEGTYRQMLFQIKKMGF